MEIRLALNKFYEKCSLLDIPKLFSNTFKDYLVSESILTKLAKNLGFSYDIYNGLASINSEAADAIIRYITSKNKISDILLLIDSNSNEIVGYSLESERLPITNNDFIYRVNSLSETSDDIDIGEIYYSKDDTISSVILKRRSPVSIEEKYQGDNSKFTDYQIGILLVNDELNSVYSRLVLYIEGQPLYLPASYYSTTTTRYKRSTSSAIEALEVLVLKVIEDLRDLNLLSKIQDFHYRYRSNKSILASYEEYNSVLKVMRKIPSVIEDTSFLDNLLLRYEDFEEKYTHLEDKKYSYLWRCTALGDTTIGSLVSITARILSDLDAPAIEYFEIRDLLGSYISTRRIAEDIAQEDSD